MLKKSITSGVGFTLLGTGALLSRESFIYLSDYVATKTAVMQVKLSNASELTDTVIQEANKYAGIVSRGSLDEAIYYAAGAAVAFIFSKKVYNYSKKLSD